MRWAKIKSLNLADFRRFRQFGIESRNQMIESLLIIRPDPERSPGVRVRHLKGGRSPFAFGTVRESIVL
jgi:hypothetical protein